MTTSTLTNPVKSRIKANTKKVLASAVVLGATAAVVGLGTYGTFTGSTSASQKVASGSAGLEMPYSDFNKPIAGMLPGDTVERIATITNPGDSALKSVLMGIDVTQSSALVTDPVNGLKIEIQGCAVPWTVNAAGPDTCGSAQWTVLPNGPLVATAPTSVNTASVNAKSTDYLRALISLPDTADASFQSLSADVNFTFSGTQRDGQFLND